jgi:phage regulator Rha-like protein
VRSIIPAEVIESRIFVIRGQKVMVDRDLAELYGVETKYLNRQVRRNIARFPKEFMFQLSRSEKEELVTICHRFDTIKHSVSKPYVFTEHGVLMLANVLKSERATRISIAIVQTFVKLRQFIHKHKALETKLAELERRVESHDTEIQAIFEAIRQLSIPLEINMQHVLYIRA